MKTHGMTKTRLFNIWAKMNYRCSPKGHYYSLGRRVCEEWSTENDKGFENFRNWALANGYSDELSIDRIDNNGNYGPDNCRWTTQVVQCNNTKRNIRYHYKDEYKTIPEFAREYGLLPDTLKRRIKTYGWSIEKAIETPIQKPSHSYKGETHTMKEWAEIVGIPVKTLKSRMEYGYSFEDAITGNIKRLRG